MAPPQLVGGSKRNQEPTLSEAGWHRRNWVCGSSGNSVEKGFSAMETKFNQRSLIYTLGQFIDQEVLLGGWVHRLRVLAKTTFIVIKDCSGVGQCVAESDLLKDLHLKLDDCVEVYVRVRADHRSKAGYYVALYPI